VLWQQTPPPVTTTNPLLQSFGVGYKNPFDSFSSAEGHFLGPASTFLWMH